MQRQPPRMIHQVDRDRRVNAVAQGAPAAHLLQLGQNLAPDFPAEHQVQLEQRQFHQIDRFPLRLVQRLCQRIHLSGTHGISDLGSVIGHGLSFHLRDYCGCGRSSQVHVQLTNIEAS